MSDDRPAVKAASNVLGHPFDHQPMPCTHGRCWRCEDCPCMDEEGTEE